MIDRGEGVIQMLSQIVRSGDRSFTERMAEACRGSGVRVLHNIFMTSDADPEFVRAAQVTQQRTDVPESRLDCLIYESAKAPAHVLSQTWAAFIEENHVARLPDIRTPTLILCGGDDMYFPINEQETLNRAIPGSKLKLYPGVGHGLQWEKPAQFVSDVTTFIDA